MKAYRRWRERGLDRDGGGSAFWLVAIALVVLCHRGFISASKTAHERGTCVLCGPFFAYKGGTINKGLNAISMKCQKAQKCARIVSYY